MQRQDVIKRYNLPTEIKYCKRCTISNQRPRISFDEEGVCSACRYAEQKEKINWLDRENELIDLCNQHRKNNGGYDVIVPCSGGKDGSFVAHQLKYKYKMNPLCVTWAPNIYTDIGRQNLQNFIASGFDHITGMANPVVNRKLVNLSFIHLGDPFQAFIYGQTNFPLKMAIAHDVSLIMYGENGEVEYGGDMKNAFRPDREIADHDKHYFSGLAPEFWLEHGLSNSDLYTYQAPPYQRILENKTKIHFMGYYKKWDPQENYYYCVENTGFSANSERTEGTYSKYASLDDAIDGFHYWLGFIKFGIGRSTSDTAHEIRDGKITRNEGIGLVRKYDGEFPKKNFSQFLEYANLNEDLFWQVVDSWRSDHIWKKKGNDWCLRRPIWDEAGKTEPCEPRD